jgi:hypothetical protein
MTRSNDQLLRHLFVRSPGGGGGGRGGIVALETLAGVLAGDGLVGVLASVVGRPAGVG